MGPYEIRTGVFRTGVSLSLSPYGKNEAYMYFKCRLCLSCCIFFCSHQPSALKMDMLMKVSLQDCLAAKHKDMVYCNMYSDGDETVKLGLFLSLLEDSKFH